MSIKLPDNAVTDRHWTLRDDNRQHFHGDIPLDQKSITLTLSWKETANDIPPEVGRYRLNLADLETAGFVRKSARGFYLRFQRTDDLIEIAINRKGPAKVVGKRPR